VVNMSGMKKLLLSLALLTATCLTGLAETPPHTIPIPLAELWVHTSAEYRGLCYQAYNTASLQFDHWAPLLEKRKDGKAYLPGGDKPVAIILDLDETVIDNSGFQSFMYRTGATYTPQIWAAWVEFQGLNKMAGPAVPGSVDFLNKVEEMGVTPIYISNREAGFEADTIKVLANNGIRQDNIEKRVLLRQKGAEDARQVSAAMQTGNISAESAEARELTDGEGHKEARRRLIQQDYDVLAYFGDVYGDFMPFVELAESTQQKFQQRRASADQYRNNFGKVWFILPNPMYGYWSVGTTIPKDGIDKALNDYGFETFVRGRRLIK
jgi:predicted secreted acid phosphatase